MPNAPVARSLGRRPQDVLEDAARAGSMCASAGQDEHDLVVGTIDGERREGDGGGGVATHRLEEDHRRGELIADEPLVAPVGHDRDVVGERPRAVATVAWSSVSIAEQRQERLRALGSTQGMQPRPAAAGHDDGVHAPTIIAPRDRRPVTAPMITQRSSQMTLRCHSWYVCRRPCGTRHRDVAVLPRIATRAERPAHVETRGSSASMGSTPTAEAL